MRRMSRAYNNLITSCSASGSRLSLRPPIHGKNLARLHALRPLKLLIILITSTLSGCASIAITLAGLGFGAGANHYMTSVNYRTFTEPLESVRQAVLTSLVRMKINLASSERTDDGVLIKARTTNRDIEIELEEVTQASTRMRTTARQDGSLLLDAATAAEISAQTEKVLTTPAPPVRTARRG